MGKSGSKDYTVGGGKKILTIIAVLVLLVIIAVVIVLCIPSNNYSTVELLDKTSATGFLTSKTERKDYNDFCEKINKSIKKYYYKEEMDDVLVICDKVNEVLDFYNNHFAFSKDNKALTRNAKSIKKTLKKIVKAENQLHKNIDDALSLEVGADSYLQNVWIAFRVDFHNWLTLNRKVISSLHKCYQDCFAPSFFKNEAGETILTTIDDFMLTLNEGFFTIISNDFEEGTIYEYSYELKGVSKHFKNFVENYVVEIEEIEQYFFDKSLQNKYTKIKKFLEVYQEETLLNLIKSIDNNGSITFSKNVELDTENLLEHVVNFLRAGGSL